jgi:hypothetical protein
MDSIGSRQGEMKVIIPSRNEIKYVMIISFKASELHKILYHIFYRKYKLFSVIKSQRPVPHAQSGLCPPGKDRFA